MAVVLAARFPLGRYHATPWDRSVNEGVVEWPPSPWRVLRALVSTWHLRGREASEEVFDGIVTALTAPPRYHLPETGFGHTRHYLPDREHRSGATGGTDLALDPFLGVAPHDELLMRWDVDLPDEAMSALADLAQRVPYLGRSESVCELRVVDDPVEPDDTWWSPEEERNGAGPRVRLLAPQPGVSRALLEVTPHQVRGARRLLPEGTRWVTYRGPAPERSAAPAREAPTVTAIRWEVASRSPFSRRAGVLATDRLRAGVLSTLDRNGVTPPPELVGRRDGAPARDDHAHAHWWWLDDGSALTDLVVWVPAGLPSGVALEVLRHRRLRGPGEWTPDGFVAADLHLVGVGDLHSVAPDLAGRPVTTWRTVTPYLPVRHRKRESLERFLLDDIGRELGHRSLPEPRAVRLLERPGWAAGYRRYRLNERMRQRRPGFAVAVELTDAMPGPLALGALSHFGFGLFRPEE